MKNWLLLIAMMLGSVNVDAQHTVYKALSSDESNQYKEYLKKIRSAVENALLKKHLDTLCLDPLDPDISQCVDSVLNGVTIRDSIAYIYSGKISRSSVRMDIHYGVCFRKNGNGTYKRMFPVWKFEEYTISNSTIKKTIAITIHALTGELILIAEDHRQSTQKWGAGDMTYYHKTPYRMLEYVFKK